MFRRTFLQRFWASIALDVMKVTSLSWAHEPGLSRDEARAHCPLFCRHSSAQCGSVSPSSPQAGLPCLPLCDTVGADGVPLCDPRATPLEGPSPPGLMPELGCLGLEVDVNLGCVLVCVSCLCYGFRWLILSTFLDLQKPEVIVYMGRELGTMWVYEQKQKWSLG